MTQEYERPEIFRIKTSLLPVPEFSQRRVLIDWSAREKRRDINWGLKFYSTRCNSKVLDATDWFLFVFY